jgi:hypothetical protein
VKEGHGNGASQQEEEENCWPFNGVFTVSGIIVPEVWKISSKIIPERLVFHPISGMIIVWVDQGLDDLHPGACLARTKHTETDRAPWSSASGINRKSSWSVSNAKTERDGLFGDS